MATKIKPALHHRIFLLLMVYSVVICASFLAYEYHRLRLENSEIDTLPELLRHDAEPLLLVGIITVVAASVGLIVSRRMGRTISRLSDFARLAEKGEPIHDIADFPAGELGEISHNIVRLYARLQRTMEERDRQQREALRQQQEKDRIKRQLTNNINHELKTPVASIQICLETLMANPDISEDVRNDLVQRSNQHCQRLIRLLGDVAQITRMEQGPQHLVRQRVSISAILDEIQGEMVLRPDGQRMNMHMTVPTENTDIYGSETMLTSIFRNLTDNALAYSGGTDIYISVENINDDTVSVIFEDNGTGIEARHLPHIFERFYRIDLGRSRRMGGTGLGLAIVKHAVELHGGVIYAENVMPHGLRFRFTLRRQ